MSTAMYAPYKEMVSHKIMSRGSMSVVAKTLVTTKYLKGLVPDTSMASICSVTFMEPNSAPMPDAIFPAQINAVITGTNSLTSETDTTEGIHDSVPNTSSDG